MAILFFEGFETVGTETGLANQATTRPRIALRFNAVLVAGDPVTNSFFLTDSRDLDGYAIQMGSNSGSASNHLQWEVPPAYRGVNASATEFIVGMWVHIPSTARDVPILTVYSMGGGSPDDHIFFLADNSQDLVCKYGYGTYPTIASASSVFTAGNWHHVELKFKIGEATWGAVEAYVDGVLAFSLTGVDTKDFWSDVRYFRWRCTANASGNDFAGYDDIYVLATSGSTPTDYIGSTAKVYPMAPDGDDTVEWTPSSGTVHYALIDENGADSADYVETATDTEVEMFALASPVGSGVVHAVKIEAEAIDTVAGANDMDVRIDSGGTVSETNWAVTSITDYAVFPHYEGDTDPNTSAAWNMAAINALKAGVQFNT